jgi:hypothetical protein
MQQKLFNFVEKSDYVFRNPLEIYEWSWGKTG